MPIKFLNDVAVDTNVLYVDTANNRVGIGTTSPSESLDVDGNISVSGNINLTDGAKIGVNGGETLTIGKITGGGAASLTLSTNTTATGGFTIDNTSGLKFGSTSGANELLANTSSTFIFGKNGGGVADYQFSSNVGDVTFVNSGNVGIGTTSPSQKLDVNGNVAANRYYGSSNTTYYVDPNNNSQAAYFAGDIRITDSGTATIKLDSTSIYPGASIVATKDGSESPPLGDISWVSNPGFQGSTWAQRLTNSPYTESSIKLPTSSSYNFAIKTLGSDRMVINSSGNVGIGTTSPDAPLHVYGTLKVEDTSTSTSSFAVIEMEGRGAMGSQTAYLRTDFNGNFSIANSTSSSSTTFRDTTLGNLISSNDSSNGNDSIFEATSNFGPSTDAVKVLFKANTNSSTGPYNEVGIEVDRMDGWTFSSTKRGKMRLQTGGNDHITMQTSVSETSSTSSTTFDQPCTFNGLSTGIGFFSGTTATFAGKVGVGRTPPVSKLDVNGGIRMADDTSTAASTNVGTLKYYTSGNNSYVDMCMQTGATTYAWVNIVTNSW